MGEYCIKIHENEYIGGNKGMKYLCNCNRNLRHPLNLQDGNRNCQPGNIKEKGSGHSVTTATMLIEIDRVAWKQIFKKLHNSLKELIKYLIENLHKSFKFNFFNNH